MPAGPERRAIVRLQVCNHHACQICKYLTRESLLTGSNQQYKLFQWLGTRGRATTAREVREAVKLDDDKWRYEADSWEPTELEGGGWALAPGTAQFWDVPIGGSGYTIKVRLEVCDSRIHVAWIQVEAQAGGAPVNSTVLHAVAVGELVKTVTGRIAFKGWKRAAGNGEEITLLALTDQEAELVRLRGPVPSSLEWTAKIYTAAQAAGLDPVQMVTRVIGLKPPTATRWVRRAKDQGLIKE